jgi:hypothetical protein
MLVIGMATGAAMFAVAWGGADRAYLDAVARFPAGALLHAGGELLFSLGCLVVYAGTWNRWRARPWLHGLWAVIAATNLLYHFPPLMVVLGTLAVRPELVPDLLITRDLFRPLMVRPEILSQSIHFNVASVAVTGLALILLAARQRRRALPKTDAASQHELATESAGRLIRVGAAIALVASVAQLFIGMWVLMELPIRVRNGMLGDDWLATGLFFLAIVGTFGMLHGLAMIALGDTSTAAVRRCVVLLVGVVLLMTGVLRTSREMERIVLRPDVSAPRSGNHSSQHANHT